jgi:DNA-binding XRE family transcriptional regulator
MNTQVQYLESNGKPEYAVIPVAVYHELLELAEDAKDIRDADEAVRSIEAGEELIDGAVVDALMTGENPVKVWRTYRGLTQVALAQLINVGKSYISQIETGNREGSVAVYKRIAESLDVDVDDLV